jgi:competence protein ComEC
MSLEVHFLNVGHGDCTLVEFPSGRLAMIDINNSKTLPTGDEAALAAHAGVPLSVFRGAGLSRSAIPTRSWEDYYRSLLVDPYDYFSTTFPGRGLFRYIQTHPDLDHLSGLHNFFIDKKVAVQSFWDTANTKVKRRRDFLDEQGWLDWQAYQYLRDETNRPGERPNVPRPLRGERGSYWVQDHITILSPSWDLVKECNKDESWNNASYVLRIDYGDRRVILPGDAEGPAWSSMLDELGTRALACDVLKAPHHGRESGYHDEAAAAMDPKIVVCSVGKKPDQDASDEWAARGAEVLSTRFHGTIRIQIDPDGEVFVYNHKDELIQHLPRLR